MTILLAKLAKLTILGLVSIGLMSAPTVSIAPQAQLGVTVPSTPALYDGVLVSKIQITDTSMTINPGTDRSGNSLSGRYCFTLDANTPQVEYVCGTASGTAVTGMSRGIDASNPNVSSTANAYVHNRFASVQATDYPSIQIQQRILNGIDPMSAALQYTNGAAGFITSSTQLASKGYVDSQVTAGAAPISNTVAGIGMLSNASQLASGSPTSSYNSQTYSLVIPNSLANATSSATNLVPVTGSNGKISSGFIDQTANYTWSGTQTVSGTSTYSGPSTHTGSTTLAGTSTFSGNVSFGILPTVTTTNPTQAAQVSSKNYVDSKASSFVAASTTDSSLNAGTSYISISTSTFTMANAGRLLLLFSGSALNNSNTDGCSARFAIDGVLSGPESQFNYMAGAGANLNQPLAINYITASQTAASHTVNLQLKSLTGSVCLVASNAIAYIEYLGQ